MRSVIVISGSPSRTSKTGRLADVVVERLRRAGTHAEHLRLRDLPPVALLTGDASDDLVANALHRVRAADGLVLATPVFKASYSGLLKVFLDLLPQDGLAGKTVLPLATGGTIAHMLAIDYGLRPVVQSMSPRHVLRGYFLVDRDMRFAEDGRLLADGEAGEELLAVVRDFHDALRASNDPVLSVAE
jgi:FMN reductase